MNPLFLPCSSTWRNKLLFHRFQTLWKAWVIQGVEIIYGWYKATTQFIVHFHQAVLENNLAEITVAYESGWNKYTEKFYSRSEWPEAEIIAPLVNDGEVTEVHFPFVLLNATPQDPIFLILYRELYYRHVYSRLQPNIDDRFHSYENSCELFNYLLSSLCFHVSFIWFLFWLQIRMVLYHSSCLNNGFGILLTNLSTNFKFFARGGRRSSQKRMTNLWCLPIVAP